MGVDLDSDYDLYFNGQYIGRTKISELDNQLPRCENAIIGNIEDLDLDLEVEDRISDIIKVGPITMNCIKGPWG